MAPWGKVHASAHNTYDRVKSGLAWAGPKYQLGVGLAGKVNELYQTGKRVAGVFMPAIDRWAPGLAPALSSTFGAIDSMRDSGIQRHQDILNKVQENGDIMRMMRQAKPMLEPYYS